jgi:amidase
MLAGDWVGATAVRIAGAVQRGEASASRVVAEHLAHLDGADRALRMVRERRDGVAPAEAELVDEQPDPRAMPLAGVPVLISENTPVAGLARWPGRGEIALEDHELVRRLRGAGAVVLGSARMSELGLWATTDDAGGLTRHPWRGDRSPGGACGGAAAAVSAGVVPLGYGTEGLGSVRIPAACCGLVGFVPGLGTSVIADHGVLATTVEDAALGFDVIAGRPHRPVREPERLRIGVSFRPSVPMLGPDREVRTALADTARRLVGLRHDVLRAEPDYPLRLARMAIGVWSASAYLDGAGDPALQRRTRGLAGIGGVALRRGLVRDGERADWQARCAAWLATRELDLLLLPAIPGAPPGAGPWAGRSWPVNAATAVRLAAYTAPWSLAGLPAIVVPAKVRVDGLPASVQLVGRPGSEARLLAVAAQLERIAPWRRHGPGWPRARGTARVEPAPVMARSGHDGAGDPGRRHVGAQGSRRRRADDPARTQPAPVGRARRAGVAQM